tara:strand:- start:1230 stop:2180 length:951 start_codon:yes stop_codon:yes gene_type:complete
MGKELSFSGLTQRVVITNLTKCLEKGDFEKACQWSIEMHISGWINKWWNEMVFFCATHFNCNNPKMSIFLLKIVNDYPGIRGIGNTNTESIRQTVAVITGALAFSPKDIPYQIPKPLAISQDEERNMLNTISNAPLNNYAVKGALKDDPPFLIRLFSQLVIAIQKGNFHGALRMISICLYVQKHKDKEYKKLVLCSRRTWKGLDKKLWHYWGLYLMDILCAYADDKGTPISTIINSWRALFVINYTSTKDEKQLITYIVTSIGLLTQKLNFSSPCIRNENEIHSMCSKIDVYYKTIFNKTLKNDTDQQKNNNNPGK